MIKFLQPIFHFGKSSIALVAFLLFLAYGYGCRHGESLNLNTIWEWLDPVSAISSFVITLVILYNQARESWEGQLEKRLNIDFVFEGNVIARVENAYLAGASDIRPWSQQLGKQMMGEMKMDMNWDEEKPRIERCEGIYVKSYNVTIYLAENPLASLEANASFRKFKEFHSRYRHSTVEFSEDSFPIVTWRRQGHSTSNKPRP